MKLKMRAFATLIGVAGLVSPAAYAEEKLRIGFLTDMSGAYADLDGKNGATAIQMAIDDVGGKVNGLPIELISADHQNKADIAASKAREWMDVQHISMLIGGTNSAASLAMSKIAREKKRVFIANGAGSSALTNEQCSPYTIHYAWDTVALARGTAAALVKQGYKNWVFLTADYAFGEALRRDATDVVTKSGGQVVGTIKHPLNAPDFSSFLLQAQSSRAQILGIANGGTDMINSLKAAKEFGIDKKMKVASLMLFITDVHSMGLNSAEGLLFTTSWDWNINDETRAFGRRFFAKTKRMPTEIQAADYSATMNYLKAVQATRSSDADEIMGYFGKNKLKDFYAEGYVRPDGRYVHQMYLMQVKSPAESRAPWDYVKVVSAMPGEEVFTTKAETRCALWK
ncbi:ABC transporter substrate-binding protein [Ralstonia sp. SET104]|uniref:ABC transporter substrate-binding protein n=1 Tax=Ralstonia sp. SET104 TaxID=2448774 RepID=UPI000F587CBA|nr:ABC transporter substrate-binding protein [Ralstonia sp. SET104]GCB03581.1 branched-chain amino acid ABC transporter substrate-binding protein [Ralstonia sp. SET104]